MITVEKKQRSKTGKCSYGWIMGRGYASGKETIKYNVWCIIENGKVIAEARSKAIANKIAFALRECRG